MSKAIDDLMHEHEAILSALKILDTIAKNLKMQKTVNSADIVSFIGFLKEFADKCHHGKEEGILFPELIKAGMPEKGGPIEVMLAEHAQGRQYIKEMESAIAETPNYSGFIESAERYSTLLSNHINKENNILFPAAEKILSGDKLEEIYEAFEQHEEKVIGQGRHEELHEMLKELKKRYVQ